MMTISGSFGPTTGPSIVLVHGAWVGEWSWRPVLDLLSASGHRVHAVSLTGHGARRHQGGPHVTLSDHVDDVVAVIETFDLHSVILVGHSYGGRVITKAYPRVASRIDAMVYLDAHSPVIAEDPPPTPERLAAAEANGGMLPFADYLPSVELLGSQAAVDWFVERAAPQSFGCLTEPWLTDLPTELAKTFVFALDNEPSRFRDYAEACRTRSDWDYHELVGTHWLMVSHPQEVAAIIVGAAGS